MNTNFMRLLAERLEHRCGTGSISGSVSMRSWTERA